MIQTIPVQKIRAHLGEIINEVYYSGREFIVERKGKPMVKIVRVATSADDARFKINSFMKFAGVLPRSDAKGMKTVVRSARKTSARKVHI